MGLQGQHLSKKAKKPNVRMEVVCDDFLRIWFLNFGAPRCKNDCQIFNQSSLFNRLRTAEWPPEHPDLPIGESFVLKWFYYLADGIYPKLRFLMSTIGAPETQKEKLFCSQQEGARKMIERLFGVLFKKYQILYRPSRLWFVEDMKDIVHTCAILHNMNVSANKANYTGTRVTRIAEEGDNVLGVNGLPTVHAPLDPSKPPFSGRSMPMASKGTLSTLSCEMHWWRIYGRRLERKLGTKLVICLYS